MKITMTLLLMLCVMVMFMSVAGFIFQNAQGYYTLAKEDVVDQLLFDMGSKESREIGTVVSRGGDLHKAVQRYPNLRFSIKHQDGTLIFEQPAVASTHHAEYIYIYDASDESGEEELSIMITLRPTLVDDGRYILAMMLCDVLYALRYWIILPIVIASIGSIFIVTFLVKHAGRRSNDDRLHTTIWVRMPWACLLAVIALIAVVVLYTAMEFSQTGSWMMNAMSIFMTMFIFGLLFLWFIINMSVRVKVGRWWKNTICYRIICMLKILGKNLWKVLTYHLPLWWKILFGFILVIIIDLMILQYADKFIFLWFLSRVLLGAGLIYMLDSWRRLSKAVKRISEGDVTYQIDPIYLIGEYRKHALRLNQIQKGMQRAVERQMKDERMKTELITNVSHDIKTPLTSIINYADLISTSTETSKEVQSYVEVLQKQSLKLKHLVEDLIEASKASSGNIEADLQACDLNVFLEQALGEYEERLQQYHLDIVADVDAQPLLVMADGKYLWRVVDNLFDNVVKYSQPNTRVYLTVQQTGDYVMVVLKNTSQAPLNVSPEELMERFVRGDQSRTSEGNGLGLSIAQSLVTLQGGSIDLFIDGDLFKVILRWPVYGEPTDSLTT